MHHIRFIWIHLYRCYHFLPEASDEAHVAQQTFWQLVIFNALHQKTSAGLRPSGKASRPKWILVLGIMSL